MTFDEILAQIIDLLKRQGRVSCQRLPAKAGSLSLASGEAC